MRAEENIIVLKHDFQILQYERAAAAMHIESHNEFIGRYPHQFVGIFENYYHDPLDGNPTGREFTVRAAIGLLSCTPGIEVVNGRIFVRTHSFYEIPDMRQEYPPVSLAQKGTLSPEWAHVSRMARPIIIPAHQTERVQVGPQIMPGTPQITVFYGSTDVGQALFTAATHLNRNNLHWLPSLNSELRKLVETETCKNLLTAGKV